MTFEKIEIFEFEEQREEFQQAHNELLDRLRLNALAKIIPPENSHGYSHGRRWQTLTSSSPDDESEMAVHEHVAEISFADIIDHKLTVIHEFTGGIISAMTDGMMRSMYQTVSEACEKSGNVVKSSEVGSPAMSFLQALKNIQFGVDRKGNVSRPEFHLDADAFKSIQEDAERLGTEFKNEVDRVTKQKEEEALAREANRVAKFKRE